jgi:recombination protein RecA
VGRDLPTDSKQERLATLEKLRARWSEVTVQQPKALSTGFAALDCALGIGGVPRGHLTLLQGMPTSGAGTLAFKVAASATQSGEEAAYLDLAGTFDPDYAVRCGVNLAHLVIVQPDSLPAAVEALTLLVKATAVAILDPALASGEERPEQADLRRLLAVLHSSSCALIVLERGGADHFSSQAALRLEISRECWLMRRRDVHGYRARVQVTRNRFGPPGQVVRLTIGFSGVVQGDGV